MATRLALAVLLVTLGSLLVTSLIALDTGENLAETITRSRLVSLRSSKGAQVEGFVQDVRRRTAALAASPMTVEAVDDFSAALGELDTLDMDALAEEETALADFYRTEIRPTLEDMRGTPVSLTELVPASPAGVYLQYHYLADSAAARGEEATVDDAGDGSEWTAVHERFHPTFQEDMAGLGVDDLYLIDDRGVIVYTTSKQTDLGTSLTLGPLSGSTLASLVARVSARPERGTVAVADLAPYAAAGDSPVGFMASPVLDGDRLAGVLAVRLPIAGITDILSGDGDWEALGLGETGEVYLAGSDGRLRSETRQFLELGEDYLPAALAAGSIGEDDERRIATSGTSVFFQREGDASFDPAATREGPAHFDNYVGVETQAIVEPLGIDGLDWTIVAAAADEEIDEPVEDFVTELVVGTAVFVVLLAFLAVVWAGRTVEPIRVISRRLRHAQGVEARGSLALDRTGPREFVELADNFEHMATTLRARRADVEIVHQDRRRFLERILPPAVARRVEEGDRQVMDRVPNATVAVLVVSGLPALIDDRPGAARRREALDDAIDALDRLAATHGLTRVKLAASAYVAACGITRPYLDQAPRTVDFARAAIELATGMAEAMGQPDMRITAGVHTGPVTVGLAGASRLVYDTWGPTVGRARWLAQLGQPGQIIVSAETRDQLPDELDVSPVGDDADPDAWLLGTTASVRSATGGDGREAGDST